MKSSTSCSAGLPQTVTEGSGRFNSNDVVTFTLTATGLTESDFNFGNADGYKMAAKVQGIPGDKSGAIGTKTAVIPEPAFYQMGALLTLGLGGVFRVSRLRRKAN